MKIGVLVFPAVEELDFIGPWEMFGMWGLIGSSVRTHLVGQSTEPLRCAKGLTVVPEYSFEDCPPLDQVGFLSAGRGITVHVSDCPNVAKFRKHPEQWIDVHWEERIKGVFPVNMRVEVKNQRGVLARITVAAGLLTDLARLRSAGAAA